MVKDLEKFKIQGFIPLQEIFDPQVCEKLVRTIETRLISLMELHQCNTTDYFSVINRWKLSVFLNKKEIYLFIKKIQCQLQNITGELLEAVEYDILYKSAIAPLPTPVHQDISYVWQKPYTLSTWIALTEVDKNDSALQFLPKSHHDPLISAVDFWQPDFIDTLRHSPRWQKESVTVTAKPGDGFLFSSSLLHGSHPHQSEKPRFVCVIRWRNKKAFKCNVPPPQKVSFGMWNCGAITHQLLTDGYEKIYDVPCNSVSLGKIAKMWQSKLHEAIMPFDLIQEDAVNALRKLQLLESACHTYGGADGQGIVYANLWHKLLAPLKSYLSPS